MSTPVSPRPWFTREDRVAGLITLGIVVLVILGIVGMWIGRSAMEARTFTKLTGMPVSTWDAMWVELRIDCH